MNVNQLINMLMRRFSRIFINKSIDFAARRGRDPQEMTPDEKARARSAKQMARRAKDAAKLMRRMR